MDETLNSNDSNTCKCCKATINIVDEFCVECGFPLKGTEEEKGKHIGRYILGIHNTTNDEREIKKSRKALLITSGVLVVSGIWARTVAGETGAFTLVGNFVLALIFAFISLWSEENPFSAFLTALSLFLGLQIISIIADPLSIIKGLIFKVVVLVFLVNGVVSASKIKKK